MVVVTGGTGFIGSVLVWKLNQIGIRDILVVDQDVHNPSKLINLKNHAHTERIESGAFLDALEKNKWLGKISAIFHMGACSSTTEMNTAYLRENNSLYSERVANWCITNKVYLQYASSAATYGNGELGFSDDDKLTPRLKPLNPYGQSKLDFDIWVLKNGYEKLITGFRYFNVYGPNEYHKADMRSMVHKGYGQVMATGKMKLFKSYKKEYPDGGQMRDFVYVKDVVDTMAWFFENQKHKGIFNLGTGRAQSWNDMATALFKACGKPLNVEYIDMPENIRGQYQYFTEADLGKLRKTGCALKFQDLEHGVSDYAAHYLSKNDAVL